MPTQVQSFPADVAAPCDRRNDDETSQPAATDTSLTRWLRAAGALSAAVAVSACSFLQPNPVTAGSDLNTAPAVTPTAADYDSVPAIAADAERNNTAPVAPLAAKPTRAKRVAPKQGGGYFQNDGPGLSPPPEIDATPDPIPRREALATWANRPYTILGKHYIPERDIKPFTQRGVASWYGRKFHGHKTAIGERYDMYGMTAAHPTLPLPSYARVTNVKTGQSVIVRVNDRGPFLNNRVIDLSYTAASKLGYVDAGHTEVTVEQIALNDTDAPNEAVQLATAAPGLRSITPTNPSSSPPRLEALRASAKLPNSVKGSLQSGLTEASAIAESTAGTNDGPAVPVAAAHYVQMAAFSNLENASWALAYHEEHLNIAGTAFVLHEEAGWYKLRAGPYASREHASLARQKIAELTGYSPIIALRSSPQR